MKARNLFALIALSASFNSMASDNQPAPAADDNLTIDSTAEVAYQCRVGNQQQKLTVMYGIKNGEVTLAQAKLENVISPGLFRVQDVMLNRFVSTGADGTLWTAMPATPDQLTQVDGGILSFRRDGSQTNTIIADKCRLDKAATTKLNKK